MKNDGQFYLRLSIGDAGYCANVLSKRTTAYCSNSALGGAVQNTYGGWLYCLFILLLGVGNDGK